jgi:hypothetical protein
VQRLATLNPLVSFIGVEAGLPRGGVTRWLLERVLPNPGVDGILVTPDEHPQLIVVGAMPPTVTVQDATSGDVVREISEVGLGLGLLFSP